MSKFIPLTRGQQTEVDDEDFEWLNEFKWYAAFKSSYANGGGYMAVRNVKPRKLYMHREILMRILERQLDSKEYVDHIDGNSLNNKRNNLRVVTPQQSAINRDYTSINKSGYRGVSWFKRTGKWQVYIKIGGKAKFLGYFDTAETAGNVYRKAAEELHGEYRRK